MASSFGRLLANHRVAKAKSQSDLQRCLEDKGYPVSIAALSKYETGDRSAPAKFIYYVSLCLELNQEQRDALLNAQIADMVLGYLSEYAEVLRSENAEVPKSENADSYIGFLALQQTQLGPETQPSEPLPERNPLTRREREVLGLRAQGFSAKDVARLLHIDIRTIWKMQQSFYRKLDARNLSEVIRVAYERGLIPEAISETEQKDETAPDLADDIRKAS